MNIQGVAPRHKYTATHQSPKSQSASTSTDCGCQDTYQPTETRGQTVRAFGMASLSRSVIPAVFAGAITTAVTGSLKTGAKVGLGLAATAGTLGAGLGLLCHETFKNLSIPS